METKSFRYDFTMKKLKYYLFNKKNCPKCKSKMTKSKQYEVVDGSNVSTASTPQYTCSEECQTVNLDCGKCSGFVGR